MSRVFDVEALRAEVEKLTGRGIMKKAIAESIGVTEQTFYRLLRGEQPSLETLTKLQSRFRRSFIREG